MKKLPFPFLLLCFVTLLSCHGRRDDLLVSHDRNDEISIATPLDRLNWSETNYKAINQLITDHSAGGKYYDRSQVPYAVLDWDQTCAHFDVEEAVMRYQLFHLRYKITKDQFKLLLKDTVNGVTRLTGYDNQVALADINQDLINDYTFLYDNYSGLAGTMSLQEIQATPQYNDFIVKIPFLYEGYCAVPGIGSEYGYPWVLYLFAGHTTDEVRALAREAISYELGNQLSKQTLHSPAGFRTRTGSLSYSYKSGLRVFPEMQNLITTFRRNGIDVFIVSASYKPVVEEFSGVGAYGYNVPPANVIAMELAATNDGKILPAYKAGWVKTFGQGKIDAITMVIKTGRGRSHDPIFAAGDSDGDYEMMTNFRTMKLSLIWNRVKGGNIGTLCKQAVDEMNSSRPRYLLQGRNENTGVALPRPESILFGKTEPQLLN